MRPRKIFLSLILALVLLVSGGLYFYGQKMVDPNQGKGTIRVGSKDFTESSIVAEIYALALEDHGYKVERKANISSSLIHNSLVHDEIDLYPEYTGTGLLSILGKPMETNPKKVYQTVKTDYQKKFKLTWLDYAQANDGQGLVIRTSVAKKYGITTISDLQKEAKNLRFASQGEFDQRQDGLAGLEKAYGKFDWKSSQVYDNTLKYRVLENGDADVTPAYTTEGQLAQTDKFTLLKDDKSFWPPYNLAPVVRDQILEKYPEVGPILNQVTATLTTKKVTQLNAKVDVQKEDYQKVAKDYYQSIKK
ncbi:glycine betaine ABC transporter substrate-binding protein [Streptococcus sobrinus]|uniref:ABC transporter, substrate-binding protein, QAT family n=6 Tax=Streptococcus sobrinus TaxID=1310 RepID=U2IKH5_9STRE|nr:glycine betaine ABC transporter substrate-binding protein [Streptococcus sobrinus]AWN18849.1 glycine/betaine ABC transporter substrate-binding protein [Streptococcus sobrinus]ERJ74401.1 ABC transporter, substrate-binding protein, QAT family [Streptococcus sobrinus W1703]